MEELHVDSLLIPGLKYTLLEKELLVIRGYIDEILRNGFIGESKSLALS